MYNSQIAKCIQFISDEWWSSDAPLVDDKVKKLNSLLIPQNLSPYYLFLLASQGLIRTLHLYDLKQVDVPDNLLPKAMVVLFQILLRVLQQQLPDGSWGLLESVEETSYAIIGLTYLACLPVMAPLSHQIEYAIQQGRNHLKASAERKLTTNNTIWTKMDSNGAENIRRSFVHAAVNTPLRHCGFGPRIDQVLANVSMEKVDKFTKFYITFPLFKDVDEWRIRAWIIEGYLFMPELSKWRYEIFGGKEMHKDKYLDYIPFSFTAAIGLMNFNMGAETQLYMMICFMLIYQADEFFDGHVVSGDLTTMAQVRKNVESIFSQLHADPRANGVNGVDYVNGKEGLNEFDRMIHQQLDRYVRFIISIPRIQKASKIDRAHLELEIKALLLANVQQCEDNLRLQRQTSKKVHASPPSTFSKWVRTTASDHVTFQYVFAFMVAILDNGEDFMQNIQIRYIALDCVARIAVIGRMINDYGSLSRDRKEMNLNSMFFPEFNGEVKSDEELCNELMSLVNYERRRLESSFEKLKVFCGSSPNVYETVRLFDAVIEFYNQVYERRDISNWL